jgi:hypothetical protein
MYCGGIILVSFGSGALLISPYIFVFSPLAPAIMGFFYFDHNMTFDTDMIIDEDVTVAVCYHDRCCFRYFLAAAIFLILFTICGLMLGTFLEYTKYTSGLKMQFQKLASDAPYSYEYRSLGGNDSQYLLLQPDGMESLEKKLFS